METIWEEEVELTSKREVKERADQQEQSICLCVDVSDVIYHFLK